MENIEGHACQNEQPGINKSHEQLNEVELANKLFDFYEPDLKFLHNKLSNIFSIASQEQRVQIIIQFIRRLQDLELDKKESN